MSAPPPSIKLRCTSWQQLAGIYRRDLTRGAIFLKTGRPPPIGTAVRIDLTLPSESVIALSGAVEAHVGEGGLGGRGPGVDIKLTAVPQSAMWLIETALAAHREQAQLTPMPGKLPSAPRTPEATLEGDGDVAQAEEQLVSALAAELSSLQQLNPFQVLAVGYQASDDDVRRAFAELTQRYHPDRFARYASSELRQMAAEIFILIRDAYRRIGDEASRATARAALPASTAARASAAPPTATAGRSAPAAPPAPPSPGRSAGGLPVISTVAPSLPSRPGAQPRAASAPPVAAPPTPSARPPTQPLPRAAGSVASQTPARGVPTVATPTPARGVPAVASPTPARGVPTSAGAAPASVGTSSSPTPSLGVPAIGNDPSMLEALLDADRLDEAFALCQVHTKRSPGEVRFRASLELIEGLRAIASRNRLEAAQRFEATLELDPGNERAARELAEMRRQATNERKGMLSRLLKGEDS
jgi:hypothetical protein